MHLDGFADGKDIHIINLSIDVYWGGTLFHTENNPWDVNVDEEELYELIFRVNIPSYAPSGDYMIIIEVQGDDLEELSCTKITFSL